MWPTGEESVRVHVHVMKATQPSSKYVLCGPVFIQLCDSGDVLRFLTRLQRYVVAWAQQA